VAAIALASLGFALSTIALRHFVPSLFSTSSTAIPTWDQVEASRNHVLEAEEALERQARGSDRAVYPYSIVAGGVTNGRELKWVADHDPVVAAHYAGFDYDHARIVRLTLAKTVYLSYRIGNHVYWTRRRIKLRKGEKLITDGRITGRTRCANRVEEMPQQAASNAEPPAAKFEEAVRPEGTALESPPVPFPSALLSRPGVPAIEPGPPSSLYSPFYAGNFISLSPPAIGGAAVCGPSKNPKKKDNAAGIVAVVGLDPGGKKAKGQPGPCGAPEPVPEPGSFLMVASGLAGLYWQVRRKLFHA
jgi:hypothetical protein